MTGYKKGDVVLVSFPFSDQQLAKKRPAVIVSSSGYNLNYPDIVIFAITSKVSGESYIINNWKAAGLLYPSSVKPVVSTIDQRLVIRKLGLFSMDDLRVVDMVMKDMFDEKAPN